jgi:hypothetical protein
MQAVIEQVGIDQGRRGEAPHGPATAEQIALAKAGVGSLIGATLPPAFIGFLEQSNGIGHNGAVIYGASQSVNAPGPDGFWQGVVEANLEWRKGPNFEAYLVLGETDLDLLTVDLDGRHPVLRDKVSSDVNERFGNVGEAIEGILKRRL